MAVARARRTPGARANRVGERFARALYRYLPLALGAGGIAAGLYWLVQGVGGAAGVLALALLVGAETEVAVWLGYLLWRRRHAPAPESVEPPAPVGAGMLTDEGDARPALPEPEPRSPSVAPGGVPHSGIGRATTARFSWSGAEIWQRWRRAEAGHLGAELVPPVGETAYVVPHAGVLHPFAARDRDLWFEHPTVPLDRAGGFSALPTPRPVGSGATLEPSPSLPHAVGHASFRGPAGPFSPDDLDRLFPPDLGPRAGPHFGGLDGGRAIADEDSILDALNDLPLGPVDVRPDTTGGPPAEPVDLRSPASVEEALEELPRGPVARPITALGDRFPDPPDEAPSPTGPPAARELSRLGPLEPVAVNEFPPGDLTNPWSGGGLLPDESSIDRLLYLEAINPIPPHLRGAPPAVAPPSRAAGPTRSAGAMACVACTRGLGDFRSWSPCIGCGRPVCRQCLHRSYFLGEEGFCWDCSRAPILPVATGGPDA